jgi:TfoX/Sxy family transcriptional regulator of competence genes
MSSQQETIDFILLKLSDPNTFAARGMFGEYALYCNGKVVALICDDTLYVKILPASSGLESECEQGPPYPGAKLHYVVTEDMLADPTRIAEILIDIAKSLPVKKPRNTTNGKKCTNTVTPKKKSY